MRILTPEQFGELAQLSAKTVVALCARGDIPGARKMGRRWRIPDWALEDSPKALLDRHPRSARERRARCLVYFVQCNGAEGPIKVGLTTAFTRRLARLRLGTPYPLAVIGTVPGGKGLEAALHRRFTAQRISGEWFAFTPELGRYIAELLGSAQ